MSLLPTTLEEASNTEQSLMKFGDAKRNAKLPLGENQEIRGGSVSQKGKNRSAEEKNQEGDFQRMRSYLLRTCWQSRKKGSTHGTQRVPRRDTDTLDSVSSAEKTEPDRLGNPVEPRCISVISGGAKVKVIILKETKYGVSKT